MQDSKATLITYFETGDTPTGAQFTNLIDSYPNIVDNNQLDGVDDAVVPVYPPTQGTATGISALYNIVPSVAMATAAVVLPTAAPGKRCYISNTSTESITVFPASGNKFKLLTTDTGYLVYPGETFMFYGTSTTEWTWRSDAPMNGTVFEYAGVVTQSSTSAPTDVQSVNTYPAALSWSYQSTGIYRLNGTGLFTDTKTYVNGPNINSLGSQFGFSPSSSEDYVIFISESDSNSKTNGLYNGVPITVWTYRI